MTEIVAAILYNFRNLTRFAGRDTRAQFWPHAIFLFIVQQIISTVLMMPVLYNMITKIFDFSQRHIGQNGGHLGVADQKALTQMTLEIFSDMQSMLIISLPVLTVLFVILIAAAVARRLHDRGKSGFWGLMPLPFSAFGIATVPIVFPGIWHHSLSVAWWAAVLLNNLLYWGALILLAVLLAQPGSRGPNRYGDGAPEPDFGDARARWGC